MDFLRRTAHGSIESDETEEGDSGEAKLNRKRVKGLERLNEKRVSSFGIEEGEGEGIGVEQEAGERDQSRMKVAAAAAAAVAAAAAAADVEGSRAWTNSLRRAPRF